MKAERLWEKVQAQAERKSETDWERQRLEASQPTKVTAEAKLEQGRRQLRQMRASRNAIEDELELKRELKVESDLLLASRMKLRAANLTAEERRLRDEEIRRGQILFARVVPENHPDWRLHCAIYFANKKL